MTAVGLALTLANNIPTIARHQNAGQIYTDIHNTITTIERAINRPIPPRYCGNCPTLTENQQQCGRALYADRAAIEITCWKCHITHNIEKLIQQALATVDNLLYTAKELLTLMAEIGPPIPSRTWRSWRAEGKIQPRGWRDAEPMYWISDVQKLLAQKPQKSATGGAAVRRAC